MEQSGDITDNNLAGKTSILAAEMVLSPSSQKLKKHKPTSGLASSSDPISEFASPRNEKSQSVLTVNPKQYLQDEDQTSCLQRLLPCLFSSSKGEKKKERFFYVNNSELNALCEQHVSNYVRTTKYTMWSFLPLSLMYQFKREANLYFLLQAVLNSIRQVSAMNPITAWSPLAFVLGVSMMREGLEDYQRYKSDLNTNRQDVMFIKEGKLQIGKSRDVKVGDMLLVSVDNEFPADMVLLASSASDASCYVQTSSLDGEKNLKTKRAAKNIDKIIPSGQNSFDSAKFLVTAEVDTEAPNGNLYSFKGNIHVGKKRYFPLSHDQLLLKGTYLKNTQWVVGFVVYTGCETRIMMNSQLGSHKQSNVERMMNLFTIQIFIAQLILTLSIAILGGYWHSEASSKYEGDDAVHFYIEFGYSSFIEGFFTFVRYFQLLNTLIPISLFVTAEMIRFAIAWFITRDAEMHSKKRDQGSDVKNMSIIEDLGQLHYIFTDKTGTLTCNEMEFKSMCIGQTVFGSGKSQTSFDSVTAQSSYHQNKKKSEFDDLRFDNFINGNLAPYSSVNLQLSTASESDTMNITSQICLMKEFMTVMAVAHEVDAQDGSRVIDIMTEDDQTDDPKRMVYSGPSPDEVTLVEFARERGFSFLSRNDSMVRIIVNPSSKVIGQEQNQRTGHSALTTYPGVTQAQHTQEDDLMDFDQSMRQRNSDDPPNEGVLRFRVERLIEFTSSRKRMSILVQDPRDNRYKLYVKGADSEISKRLKTTGQDVQVTKAVHNFTEQASEMGLRTLYFAMKILDENEVHQFQVKCERAEQNFMHKDEKLEKVYSELESELTLLGATAVEDKLQDKVPDIIHDFQRAQIKVWMLTGDKLETAKNIAASCKLLQKDDIIYELRNKKDVSNICSIAGIQRNQELIKDRKRRAIVVQSEALAIISNDNNFRSNFIRISKTCEAVICCRVSPKQKADVVRMIKMHDRSLLTMAVGDGNNDVSMINEAHVGVGLYGNEGMRAVQASDFAIPEFQMLWPLIFIHGRARYASISTFILYFFYKNVALTMPHYFYAYYCGFSAMTVFDEWFIQLYNIVFTSVPVIALGIFDWDVHPSLDGEEFKHYLPLIYYPGQIRQLFNVKQFFQSQLRGLVHAAIIFFVTFLSNQDGAVLNSNSGYSSDLWTSSVCAFTSLVITVNINLIVRSKYLTKMHLFCFGICSLTAYLSFMWMSNFTNFSWTQFAVEEAHISANFYFNIILTVSFCLVIDLATNSYSVLIKRTPISFLRQVAKRKQSIESAENQKVFFKLQEVVEVKLRIKSDKKRYLDDHREEERLRIFNLSTPQYLNRSSVLDDQRHDSSVGVTPFSLQSAQKVKALLSPGNSNTKSVGVPGESGTPESIGQQQIKTFHSIEGFDQQNNQDKEILIRNDEFDVSRNTTNGQTVHTGLARNVSHSFSICMSVNDCSGINKTPYQTPQKAHLIQDAEGSSQIQLLDEQSCSGTEISPHKINNPQANTMLSLDINKSPELHEETK